MKNTIGLLIATLVCPLAMACPEINGTYTCQGSDGETSQETIRTYLKDGVYVYETDTEFIYADGSPRQFSEETMRGTMTATCNEETLYLDINGEIVQNGQTVGTMKVISALSKMATGYSTHTVGTAVFSGHEFPINDTTNCQLN